MPERMSAKEQAFVDAGTWIPVAFFSIIETPGGNNDLCQLWVTPLGQSEWRPVEKRNIAEMTKAYKECQGFNENEAVDDFRE